LSVFFERTTSSRSDDPASSAGYRPVIRNGQTREEKSFNSTAALQLTSSSQTGGSKVDTSSRRLIADHEVYDHF
jgi:hypothetical protein